MSLKFLGNKDLKNLKKENLIGNMTNIELVLNMLAEVTTTVISRQEKPETFEWSRTVARRGGTVAKNVRRDIENRLGRTVISPLNATDKPSPELHEKSEETDENEGGNSPETD